MQLLYADLPDQPSTPESAERGRVDLFVGGLVAAAGVALVGGGVVGDLVRRRPDEETSEAWVPEEAPSVFTGVERVVGPEPTAPPELSSAVAAAPELDFPSPPDPVVEDEDLPAPGPATKTIAPRNPSPDPTTDDSTATPPPTTTAPTATTTTVPPATTLPPATTVPVTTTAPVPTTTAPATTAEAPTSTTTVPTPTTTPASDPGAVEVLASTTGFPITDSMRRAIAGGGVPAWVEQQLAPASIEDPVVDEALRDFDLLDAPSAELRDPVLAVRAHAQVEWAAFTRAFIGEAQVSEAAVECWREHFAISLASHEVVLLEQSIRRHALGDYRDLLVAVAQSPGMLRVGGAAQVDGRADRPVSTSFARLIIDEFGPGGLTVGEVRAAAEVLSGWGVGSDGSFAFDASRHRAAPARVGGWMTPGRSGSAGLDDGVSLLRHLATMPATSRRVGERLCRRLIGNGATPSTVDAAVTAYRGGGADLAAAARTALLSARGGGGTGRRGDDWVRAVLRAIRAEVDITRPWNRREHGSVAGEMRAVGASAAQTARRQRLSRDPDWWSSPTAVSARWSSARRLVAGGPGISVDLGGFMPTEAMGAARFVDELAGALGCRLAPDERDAVVAYLGMAGDAVVGPASELPLEDLVALIVSFPSFMRRDGGVR